MDFYSPFGKPIQEIVTEDLDLLRHVNEGWYVEYKQEAPNASTLAKAISAFANTYGGWLFIGIAEESKDNSVAGSFPGISCDEVDPILQRMRKSAADSIHPTPHFEIKVLRATESESHLESNRAIICAWIPQSTSAPHVHKTGNIYRRVADSSEPRPETDRYVLDQLWKRADEIKSFHKSWYEQDPEFSESEKHTPYIRLMLTADKMNERDLNLFDKEAEVRKILNDTDNAEAGIFSIPFDTVYTSSFGYVGRQLSNNNIHNLGLTWRLGFNLRSDILIPLPRFQVDTPERLTPHLAGYANCDKFISILKKYQTDTFRIVDLNHLFNIFMGIAKIQDRLCALAGWDGNYYIKMKILNAWRIIPFLDIQEVLESFNQYGLPMCLDSMNALPRGTNPQDYFEVFRDNNSENLVAKLLPPSYLFFKILTLLFGISEQYIFKEDMSHITALTDAGARANEVQTLRNMK